MTTRRIVYLVIGLDVLFIAALVAVPFLLGSLRPAPLAELRVKVEASSSLEDLRPRALKVLAANEAADQAIQHLHGVIIHLSRLGIGLTAANLVLLYFLLRQVPLLDAKT